VHRQRSRGENNSKNLTSVPASIVEQTLALYYIILQRSRASASANILSFWSELGCPKSSPTVVLLRLSCPPHSLYFLKSDLCGFFVSRGWPVKNRLGNKVLAELNVEHRRLTRVAIKASHILYLSCAYCWTFTTYEVTSKAPVAWFKVAHLELHLCHALALQRL